MDHLTWYVIRAAGVTAYLLLFLTTATGLMLSGPAAAWWRGVPVLALHRFLTYLGTAFLAVHVVVLLADSYLTFSVAELLVPFLARYERWWTGIGVIALYMLAVVAVTAETRRYLRTTVWYAVHLVSYPAFVFSTAHGIMAGSDTPTLWMLALYVVCAVVAVVLFVVRFVSVRDVRASLLGRWSFGVLAGGAFGLMVVALISARVR